MSQHKHEGRDNHDDNRAPQAQPANRQHPDRRSFLKTAAAAGAAANASALSGAGNAMADDGDQNARRLPPRHRLIDLTATEVVHWMRTGALSAETYARALLDQAVRMRDLNALTNYDPDQVLEDARNADIQRRRTPFKRLGALHGLPLLLKDNIDTRKLPTTGATPALRNNRPQHDAAIAKALFAAGGILLAKCNMHELAFGITSNNPTFGPVRNPYDRTKIPGGSSGGNGAATAARIAPAGIGSDTGGSTRVPAALCGIAGMRPTVGRYPAESVVPISRTRDTPGPITRDIADMVMLDNAITGACDELQPANLQGLRIGVPRQHFWENLDPKLAPLAEDALRRLRNAGAVLVEANIPNVAALNDAIGFPIAIYEVMRDLPNYLVDHGSVTIQQLGAQIASPDVAGLFSALLAGVTPPSVPDAVYIGAVDVGRVRLQQAYRDYLRTNNVAAIVFPTTPLPARPIGQDVTVELNGQQVPTFNTFIRNADPAGNAGIPGISIPIGLDSDGLPVGIEFDGPAYSDRQLLAIAWAAERVMGRTPGPAL